LDPVSLPDTDDETFDAVVGADLRRTTNAVTDFPRELSEGLRGPAVRQRWHDVLVRLLASVSSQIETADNDFAAAEADLRREILLDEQTLAATDERAWPNRVVVLRQGLAHKGVELQDLTREHRRNQAKKVRFRTQVEQQLLEARVLLQDRPGYADLIAGIREHQRHLVDEEIEPNEFDLALWALVDGGVGR
jgi:hypothetical protein